MKTFLILLLIVQALTLVSFIGRGWAHLKKHPSHEAWELMSHAGSFLTVLGLLVLGVMA